MANRTYVIMDESHRHERKRRPMLGADDYCIRYILGKPGVNSLLENACSEEERAFIEKQAERLETFEWAYNCIYILKMACGHYELFQTQVKNDREAGEWIEKMAKDAQTRECTRCVCGWDR